MEPGVWLGGSFLYLLLSGHSYLWKILGGALEIARKSPHMMTDLEVLRHCQTQK